MTGAAGVGEARRLDELAAVTREYGAYSSARGGLAAVVLGAWSIATFVVALRSETWGRIAALWSPALAVCALAAGKRYYQRFGMVVGAATALRTFATSTWTAAVFMGSVTVNVFLKSEGWASKDEPFARLMILGAIAVAPIVPLVVERTLSGRRAAGSVFVSIFAAQWVAGPGGGGSPWVLTEIMLGGFAVVGALMAAEGLVDHAKYRALQRRIALLRSPSA